MSERDEEDRERERPSWREIDQRKNRSSHVSREPKPSQGKNKGKDDWLRKMALKEANKHFRGKQGTPAHDKAVSALQGYYGTRKFQTLAKQYLKEYGLPEQWGPQFLFLDYEDPEIVLDLLQTMASTYPGRSLREQQAFLSRLRTLKTLAEDGAVQDQAAEILSSLS
ncbi:MAG TPA: hypothetical protein VK564_11600 [Thermodesulfobacteriota bacterium]|nr:hypothetical protein [Thermodesulfobacteriota bacterium]